MLAEAVESYLALRRSLGFALKNAANLLRGFARFASERQETHVSAKNAIVWARLARSPQGRDCRLKTVIRFARHVRAEDPRHEVPPDGVFGHQPYRRRVPFIFTLSEIRRLLEQAADLEPQDSLQPYTYRTLFSLLWVTGLRISEALALRLDDLTPDGLVIRETKFHKSRLVPLHETAAPAVQRYLARRCRLAFSEDYLFVRPNGQRLAHRTVWGVFRKLVHQARLERGPGQPTPRIMDLRHTFAVRALESCPVDRDQIDRHLLALSTYMGHASVADTYWYLEATPQLMQDIAKSRQVFAKGGSK